MDKTRIGFVGTGLMGQCAHLWNYIAIEECAVVALAELRPELARLVGQRYGIPKVYTSGAEMLAAESLDAIVSTHPFQRLGQLMPPLLEHGLPVMTENPIGRSVEVGEKLARLSKKYQAPLVVNRSGRVTVYSDPEGGTPQSVTPDFPNVHAMRNLARNFIKEVNDQATGLCRANDTVKYLVTMRDYLNQLLENQKENMKSGLEAV